MNEEVKAPIIFLCSVIKLSSYLVTVKLYHLEKAISSVQCKRKLCQTCHNVKETETFTSTSTSI